MAAINYAVRQLPADWQERVEAPGSVATVNDPDDGGIIEVVWSGITADGVTDRVLLRVRWSQLIDWEWS